MEANLKKILRTVSLELRHILEGRYDEHGHFHPGDLERRLNEIGIWRDRSAKAAEEMPHLSVEDRSARTVIDAYILFRKEAGVSLADAVAEFVRESAYTWANRLFALRCMEARAIIDDVILQKDAYGGRSMVHNRFARKNPEACSGEDDGLFVVLFDEFTVRAGELPTLFDSKSPAVALRPSIAALKQCIALLSGRETVRGQEAASDEVFNAPDAFGWAYQFWNAEEKDRVFEMVRTQKGAKIEGADIIPATQLYTEPYMVKFLVQNSLGAIWMGMHPESTLSEKWEYYVNDANRVPIALKPVSQITFLDPAVGSGHFLLEGFDVLFAMYEEEGDLETPEEICASILNNNLFGIDIDGRAVQIAAAALWMKAKEKAPDLEAANILGFREHLIATNIRLPNNKDHLEIFLKKHPEDEPLRPALETVFQGLENAHELGSLLQIEEPVERALMELKQKDEIEKAQHFKKSQGEFWDSSTQSVLPFNAEDWKEWKSRTIKRLELHFAEESQASDITQGFFSRSAQNGLFLFDVLTNGYDVVVANPPYLGFRKMGGPGHKYLKNKYKDSCYDLYAVFIDRNLELARDSGYVAMVTMHSYMFVPSLVNLRKKIVVDNELVILAHLGAFAFEELGDHAPAVLTIVQRGKKRLPSERNTVVFPCSTQKDKNRLLLQRENLKTIPQKLFSEIAGFPFIYSLTDELLKLFTENVSLSTKVDYRNGMFTTHNQRFLRFHWEVSYSTDRWKPYYKIPVSERWYTPTDYIVDWGNNGERLKNYSLSKHSSYTFNIVNERYFFKPGIALKATGSMGPCAKILEEGHICDIETTGIFSDTEELPELLFLHNSRLVLYLLHLLNPTPHFYISDMERIPYIDLCDDDRNNLSILLENIVAYKKIIYKINRCETVDYEITQNDLSSIRDLCIRNQEKLFISGIGASICETIAENILLKAYLGNSYKSVYQEAGEPEANYPLISNYNDPIPGLFETAKGDIELFSNYLINAKNNTIDNISTESIQQVWKLFSESLAKQEDSNGGKDDDDCEESDIASHVSLPTETLIQGISKITKLNPISVYWILDNGIRSGDCRCVIEDQGNTSDKFTTIILRLLGHRWPIQIKANEPIPEWADEDGIIPLSEDCGERALFDRVRERISEEFPGGNVNAIEQEFSEIIGTSLDKWIAGSFFKRHISQFKKRPVAWHIQSSPSISHVGRGKSARLGGNGPAFAALLYYQRLGYTTILDIRKLYVDKLRVSYETEQRTLEGISQPTTEQSSRKIRLEGWIDELKVFDKKLEEVAKKAFCPEKMSPVLRKYAFDDAMLSLVACWLKRLSQTVQLGPLKFWQEAAEKSKLHHDFPQWLCSATERLDYFCCDVGPKAPEAKNILVDPTPADLAPIISSHAAIMVKSSIAKACDSWWKEFDTAVLLSVRQKISESDDKAKLLEEERELTGCSTTRKMEIERLIKQLKADIKGLKKELSEKTEKAKIIRKDMESWQCKEAGLWEGWLATQPLFDKFAQLDATKVAPSTIAEFIVQESAYYPDINDGVRVNIAPLQMAGLLAADVIPTKDLDMAISDRADWRANERRWCREGKLPQPGWWKAEVTA